jgi:hypothetical protein
MACPTDELQQRQPRGRDRVDERTRRCGHLDLVADSVRKITVANWIKRLPKEERNESIEATPSEQELLEMILSE